MQLNHLHLHVADRAKGQGFYEDLFGLRELWRDDEQRIVFLGDGHGFELALMDDPQPGAMPEWFHFGFKLESREAVERQYDRAKTVGAAIKEPLTDEGEFVWFRVLDPDGYAIEVYWEQVSRR